MTFALRPPTIGPMLARRGPAAAAIALLFSQTSIAVAQAPVVPPAPPPPVTSPPGPPAPPPPRGAPGAAPRPTSYVWITTTNAKVALERRVGSLEQPQIGTGRAPLGQAPPAWGASNAYGPYWESDWERVCITPCQTQVATGGVYRVAGEGVTPSEAFPVRPGRMGLDVAPGNESAKRLGSYMAVFGFLLAAAGGVFLGISLASNEKDSADANRVATIISTAGLVGGGVLGISGVILTVVNNTDVRDESGKVIASGAPAHRDFASLNAVGTF